MWFVLDLSVLLGANLCQHRHEWARVSEILQPSSQGRTWACLTDFCTFSSVPVIAVLAQRTHCISPAAAAFFCTAPSQLPPPLPLGSTLCPQENSSLLSLYIHCIQTLISCLHIHTHIYNINLPSTNTLYLCLSLAGFS